MKKQPRGVPAPILCVVLGAVWTAGCAGGDILVGTADGGGATVVVTSDLSSAQMNPADSAVMEKPADLSMVARLPDLAAPLPDLAASLPDFYMMVPPDMGVPTVPVGAIVINEVNATNVSGLADEDGEFHDWIELYNTTAQPIDLTGVGLSNTGSAYLWAFPPGAAIPAKAYLVVFASNKDRRVVGRPLHTNFTVDNGVDSVTLTAPGNVRLDSYPAARTKADISWCRTPDVTGPFEHCLSPSPGAMNGGVAYPVMLTPPSVSTPGGFYAAAQTIILSTIEMGATIHYTLDGSDPTINSPTYNAPIQIASRVGAANNYSLINTSPIFFYAPQNSEVYKATLLRSATFANGKLSSPINTHTYFVDPNIASKYAGYPVTSIGVDPPQFWSPSNPSGIMNLGPNPGPGGWYPGANWWLGDTVPVSLEMFASDHSTAFRIDAGNKVAGGYSQGYEAKGLDVDFKDYYGGKELNYPIFPERSYTKYKEYRLRQGGSEFGHTELRDVITHDLFRNTDLPYSAAVNSVLFVNGEYWGWVQIREQGTADFVGQTYPGVDTNAIDVLDTRVTQQGVSDAIDIRAGTEVNYDGLRAYVAAHGAQIQADFTLIQALIDPVSWAGYWNLNQFVNNNDWPHNNFRIWRQQSQDGVWRCIIHDDDFAFGFAANPTTNPYGTIGNGTKMGDLMGAFMKNPQMRTLFINAVADQINTSFDQALMMNLYSELSANSMPLLADHFTRWHPNGHTINDWTTEMATVQAFMTQREANYLTMTQQYFGLPNMPMIHVTLDVNDLKMGNIKVNTLDLTGRLTNVGTPWVGRYFPNVPITLTANPLPGYKFMGWSGGSMSNQATITPSLNADGAFTATFAIDPNYKPPTPAAPPPAGLRNVALGAIATQSSTAGAAYAQLALDGDISGDPTNASIAITNNDLNAWWQADLGQMMNVYNVTLFTRTDCCADQFADVQVFVSTADMTGRSYASLLADQSVFKWNKRGVPGSQVTLPVGVPGRYVRVQLAGTGSLALAEVQVQAIPLSTLVPDLTLLRNLALGQAATQSSTDPAGAPAAAAVDGNPDGKLADKSTTLTLAQATPWWEVDLGASHVLSSIQLVNRTDCCQNRLANFTVFIANQPMDGKTLAALGADATVWKFQATAPVGTLLRIPSETIGRYVRVELTGNGPLSLAEVVVMGLVPSVPPPP